MRIEKYHAEDMQEAFRLIKADLGSDAVVIQTRKVRLGLFGIFKKPVYEVIAAVDEEAQPTKFASSVSSIAKSASKSGTGASAKMPRLEAQVAAPRPQVASGGPVATPARAQAAYVAPKQPAHDSGS